MRGQSEDGWTLIELLVTMVVSLVILAGVLSVWAGAAANENHNAQRYETLDVARTALERMTRDVREAVSVTGITDRLVSLKLWTRDLAGASPSSLHVVTYNCGLSGVVAASYKCVRTDVTAGTLGKTVVDRLSSPSVFTATAGQPNLQLRLSVLIKGAVNPVVLHSGASPRNCVGALPCAGP
jgi:prepilin-type N-terminal cleavage/methylation domain-containing protein